MKHRWLLVVPLTVVMFVAGCAVHVGGTATPAPGLAPRSLGGPAVDHVLLGDETLSRILKQPLDLDLRFPPQFGGAEALQDAGTALPDRCLGVVAMLQQGVYESSEVEEVAVAAWRHATKPADVTDVKEGVVSLPTAADADALFATFSRQWQECNGAQTSLPGGVFRLKGRITDVQTADSVVAATVWEGWRSSDPDSVSIPARRAIAVRGNCLIEVEVDFFNSARPPARGPADLDDSAVEIARFMMDRVGSLI
ncbi:sensor domain-containing protein [Mycobacterium terramassiliense]|uniref:Lipoprotein LppR n=1 Tax=Mycobacterium terramassiliense TaxID=1841859 RepID=A0A2U3NJN5_9MYCO|nr:sensor domain-containing protein [Mycobacterium terramassiliense]SPM31706.1 lipoprotein LppR [Mycobacterium terramassiliense]